MLGCEDVELYRLVLINIFTTSYLKTGVFNLNEKISWVLDSGFETKRFNIQQSSTLKLQFPQGTDSVFHQIKISVSLQPQVG